MVWLRRPSRRSGASVPASMHRQTPVQRDRASSLPGYHPAMLIARIAVLAVVWVVSGCSAASSSRNDTGSLTPSGVQPTHIPDTASPGSSRTIALPDSVTDPVAAEIARLASVPLDQVTVISAEAIAFPDGGLGCPLPGMQYPQVQVDGFKIVAQAGGVTYDFRGTGSTLRRCENPNP